MITVSVILVLFFGAVAIASVWHAREKSKPWWHMSRRQRARFVARLNNRLDQYRAEPWTEAEVLAAMEWHRLDALAAPDDFDPVTGPIELVPNQLFDREGNLIDPRDIVWRKGVTYTPSGIVYGLEK